MPLTLRFFFLELMLTALAAVGMHAWEHREKRAEAKWVVTSSPVSAGTLVLGDGHFEFMRDATISSADTFVIDTRSIVAHKATLLQVNDYKGDLVLLVDADGNVEMPKGEGAACRVLEAAGALMDAQRKNWKIGAGAVGTIRPQNSTRPIKREAPLLIESHYYGDPGNPLTDTRTEWAPYAKGAHR